MWALKQADAGAEGEGIDMNSDMNPEIRERRQLRLMGLTLEGDDKSPFILQLWVRLSAQIGKISDKVNPEVLYGVWRKQLRDGKLYRTYMTGVEVASDCPVPAGFEAWELYPAQCAVFSPRGDIGQIVGSYRQIHAWFVAGTQKPAMDGYAMEIYDTRQSLAADYLVEIWEELAR